MKPMIFVFAALFLASLCGAQEKKAEPLRLSIGGMHCTNCAKEVTEALEGVKGVEHAKVSFEDRTAEVELSPDSKVSTDVLVNAVSDAGFTATITKPTEPSLEAKKHDHEMENCDKQKTDCCKKGIQKEQKTNKADKKD